MTSSILILAARLVTCDPRRATLSDPLGVMERAGLLIEDGVVSALGPADALVSAHPAAEVHHAPLVTPGLVDAHTHAPWAGSRHAEYGLRLQGAGYEQLAAAGGGIAQTMGAVRAASLEELTLELRDRVGRMASLGVTTIEAKSGYGLDEANERKQLTAVATVERNARSPRLVPTYLALHALPPEAKGDRAAYAERVAREILPAIAADGLALYVDAYIDRSAFSVVEARPALEQARALGLGVRMHVGQFAEVGGVALAAELGAASVDHLEHLDPRVLEALAYAGTRAVLLPTASFTLGQAPPDVLALRAAGVKLVVASDANPGTAPTESLPLAMALAARLYGLSLSEVLLGATREAAISLGLGETCGVLREGMAADVACWDLPHEAALMQPWGVSRALLVLRGGVALHAGLVAS